MKPALADFTVRVTLWGPVVLTAFVILLAIGTVLSPCSGGTP